MKSDSMDADQLVELTRSLRENLKLQVSFFWILSKPLWFWQNFNFLLFAGYRRRYSAGSMRCLRYDASSPSTSAYASTRWSQQFWRARYSQWQLSTSLSSGLPKSPRIENSKRQRKIFSASFHGKLWKLASKIFSPFHLFRMAVITGSLVPYCCWFGTGFM